MFRKEYRGSCKRNRSYFYNFIVNTRRTPRWMNYKHRMQTRLIGYALDSEYRHVALVAMLPRGRRFFDSTVAASVFHEGTCFGRGPAFSPISRFGIYSRLPDARSRARFCRYRDLSFLAAREYISRTEATARTRVTFMICGVFGRSGCAKGGLSRGYLRVIIMNFSSKLSLLSSLRHSR